MTSSLLQESTVAQIAKLDRLAVFCEQDVAALQVPMDHPHTVKVPESFQDLARILATDSLTQTPVPFAEVSDAPSAHVLQVDAENVIFGDFSAVVIDYILVVEELESVDLMFKRFDFLLV